MQEKEISSKFIQVLEHYGIPADVVERQIHQIRELPSSTDHIIHIKQDYFNNNQKKFEEIFNGIPADRYPILSNGVLYFSGECMNDVLERFESSVPTKKYDKPRKEQKEQDAPKDVKSSVGKEGSEGEAKRIHKIPENPKAILISGGSIEQRDSLARQIIKASSSVISTVENQEKTAMIVFLLSSDESVRGLTFEQAAKLVHKKNIELDSSELPKVPMMKLFSMHSGVIDLGPIPESELRSIPEFIIDSSQQKLIEEKIQQLLEKLLSPTKFTLKKENGYQLIYTESAASMEKDTDKLIDFGIRLSAAPGKSFYIQEENINLLNKLAKKIEGGQEIIQPLLIKTKWRELTKEVIGEGSEAKKSLKSAVIPDAKLASKSLYTVLKSSAPKGISEQPVSSSLLSNPGKEGPAASERRPYSPRISLSEPPAVAAAATPDNNVESELPSLR